MGEGIQPSMADKGIGKGMRSLADAAREGVDLAMQDMVNRYAERIVAGEAANSMGVPDALREQVKARVQELTLEAKALQAAEDPADDAPEQALQLLSQGISEGSANSDLDFGWQSEDRGIATAVRVDEAEVLGVDGATQLAKDRAQVASQMERQQRETADRNEQNTASALDALNDVLDSTHDILNIQIIDALNQQDVVQQQMDAKESIRQLIDAWVTDQGASQDALLARLREKGLDALANDILSQ